MSQALRIAHGPFGRVALLDMDRPLVRHAHPHCHVLFKVEGADAAFSVGDRIAPLTDTTAVLVNGWEPHAYIHDPERPKTLILALYIEPDWLDLVQRGWRASGAPGFFARCCGEVTPAIRNLARGLAVEMMSRPDEAASHQDLLSGLMIAVIERFAVWRSFAGSLREIAPVGPRDWRVRRAIQVMRDGIEDGIEMDAVATGAGVSRAQLFRLFEADLAVSPRVYFNAMRMERAIQTVLAGDIALGAVGECIGFASPTHFSRFFRDHAGVAPSEFRTVARAGLAPLS